MGADQEPAAGGLGELLAGLERAAPPERIAFRNPVLEHGPECVGPLARLAERRPDLRPTVVAWLEVLARRDPAVRAAVRRELGTIAKGADSGAAREALERLAPLDPPRPVKKEKGARKAPRGPSPAETLVRRRIEYAAREQRVITYSELETNRAHIGGYLHRMALEDAAAGRPPVCAIVVNKADRRPGPGFLPAMQEIGYARPGEPEFDVWRRARDEVFAWWRDR